MPEFPMIGAGYAQSFGAQPGSSSGGVFLESEVITFNPHLKGVWTELTPSTPFDAAWIVVQPHWLSSARFLIDIGVGGAGSEQVIVPDLTSRPRSAQDGGGNYLFPIFIPRGSRVSARCQDSVGGSTTRISITLLSQNHMNCSGGAPVSAYGNTSASVGTLVDPGATAHTDGAWTEITAGTTRAHNWLVASFNTNDFSLAAAQVWRISLGIGGSGSEVVLVNELHCSASVDADINISPIVTLPIHIPAGSRISARARCNVNTANDRVLAVMLYGAG